MVARNKNRFQTGLLTLTLVGYDAIHVEETGRTFMRCKVQKTGGKTALQLLTALVGKAVGLGVGLLGG